jgi:nucleoside-diphosphate-sugar epimerase
MAAAGHQVTGVLSGGQQPCPQVVRMARIVPASDTPALTATCRDHDAICDLSTVPDTPASTCLHLLRTRARRSRQRLAAAAHAAIAASGVRRLIQRSAASVYADEGHAWLDETSPVMPGPLIRSCLDAEAAAAGHAQRGGDAIVLRLGAAYGPDDPVTRAMIRTARRGWQPFEGPPNAYRPTVSGQDAAAAVVRALYVPPGTYNVADTPTANRSGTQRHPRQRSRCLAPAPTASLPPCRRRACGPLAASQRRRVPVSRRLDREHQRTTRPRPRRPSHALNEPAGSCPARGRRLR